MRRWNVVRFRARGSWLNRLGREDGINLYKKNPESQGVLRAEEMHGCSGRTVASGQPLRISHPSVVLGLSRHVGLCLDRRFSLAARGTNMKRPQRSAGGRQTTVSKKGRVEFDATAYDPQSFPSLATPWEERRAKDQAESYAPKFLVCSRTDGNRSWP